MRFILFFLLIFLMAGFKNEEKRRINYYSWNSQLRLSNGFDIYSGKTGHWIGYELGDGDIYSLRHKKAYHEGDYMIARRPDLFFKVKLDKNLPEVIVYSPQREFNFKIPFVNGMIVSEYAGNDHKASIRRVNYEDLSKYRNLALNPYDWNNENYYYPHAELTGKNDNAAIALARKVIDGKVNSSEPEDGVLVLDNSNNSSCDWMVDFGRLVEVDKVNIFLNKAWQPLGKVECTLEFSDGSLEKFKIKDVSRVQSLPFSKKKTSRVKIKFLKHGDAPANFPLAEVEVWGQDVLPFTKCNSWQETMRTFEKLNDMGTDEQMAWIELERLFPLEANWLMQDTHMALFEFVSGVNRESKWEELVYQVLSDIKDEDTIISLKAKMKKSGYDILDIYLEACKKRRKEFLSVLEEKWNNFVFIKRHQIVPSFYAYTEGLSEARGEMNFWPDAELCQLKLNNGEIEVESLLKDPKGVIRDLEVSYDGKRIMFAWKKSVWEDDYHIYEMNIRSREIRQLTHGLGSADIEPCYLPDNNILFNSTRCEQVVDCATADVSNMYIMNKDGEFMRRIGFDQVHTSNPAVINNGKVVYTRWDYNDRNQVYPQPLFEMNIDGTAQTEYYGNNSWYPTTITHARPIPGTHKIVATLCGHHTPQVGEIGLIDITKGREENSGVELLAPRRTEKAVRIDAYAQERPLFQYPYALNEKYFLAAHRPYKKNEKANPRVLVNPYKLYFVEAETGAKELLVSDNSLGCREIIPLHPREKPHIKPQIVDYSRNSGTYTVENVYFGKGSKGIKPGTIEKIRVVAMEFRPMEIGHTGASDNEGGIGVGGSSSSPVALGFGAWDVKKVLGEVEVNKDGSAMFEVPARQPVYFQLVDTNGYVAQTMRSWSTLQPGEYFSCVGCHEDKNESPTNKRRSQYLKTGVRKLKPFYNVSPETGFGFRKHIQPIIDKHCIHCHYDRNVKRLEDGTRSVAEWAKDDKNLAARVKKHPEQKAFSLLNVPVPDTIGTSKRIWNDAYLNLLQAFFVRRNIRAKHKEQIINWLGSMSMAEMYPPYSRGSSNSKICEMLRDGHGGVKLSKEELDKISCWIDLYVPYIGDYKEAANWSEGDKKRYEYFENKKFRNEQIEKRNIEEYIKSLKNKK